MNKSIIIISSLFLIAIIPSCSTQKKETVPDKIQNVTENVKPVRRRVRIDDPVLNAIALTAWDNFQAGRYEQAALDFERLYKKGYDHYDILFGAGVSYLKYYDLKKSIEFLNLTITKKPDHFPAIFFRGVYYNNLKKYTEAKRNFSEVLLIDATEKFTCGYYAKDYADAGDLKRMQDEINRNLMN